MLHSSESCKLLCFLHTNRIALVQYQETASLLQKSLFNRNGKYSTTIYLHSNQHDFTLGGIFFFPSPGVLQKVVNVRCEVEKHEYTGVNWDLLVLSPILKQILDRMRYDGVYSCGSGEARCYGCRQ